MIKRSSYEIKSERKKLLVLLTDNTEENKKYFLNQLQSLQSSCPHQWDTAVDAIQKINGDRWICQICGKRFNI